MKKVLTSASIVLIAGLSYFASRNTDIDLSNVIKTTEKTYMVELKGEAGKEYVKENKAKQNEALASLSYSLPLNEYKVTNTYELVFNGFAVKLDSKYKNVLESLPHVAKVFEEHVYAQPQATPAAGANDDGGKATLSQRLTNYSAQTMKARPEDIQEATGGTTSQGGKNISIGIIDTGLYLNQVEGTTARTNSANVKNLNAAAFKDLAEEGRIKDSDVKTKLELSATTDYYTRINKKVFFARDYAGSDNDVDPTKKGSEHGTHVASIATANGDQMKGIAPNAQLAVLKVFGDNGGGAGDTAITAALEDAAKLGLDIVNLSLGTDLTNADDTPNDSTYKAIEKCQQAGVIVNYSAGNSGKQSFSSSKTYSDWSRDMVEGSILGSSAHYDESCNIVASSNNNEAFYSSIMTVQKTGVDTPTPVSYSDQVVSSTTQHFDPEHRLTDLLWKVDDAGKSVYQKQGGGETTDVNEAIKDSKGDPIHASNTEVEKDYVVVPGVGKGSDYNNIDVNGKIAVVHRGSTTFVSKINQAQAHGAIAMICINNDASVTFNFSMDLSTGDPQIPVVFAFKNSTPAFGDAESTGKLKISTNSVQTASDGNTVSSFSSDGGDYNLDIGIDIAAPGKAIIGAVDAEYYSDDPSTADNLSLLTGYEYFSGTSMSNPNFTGAMALYLGERSNLNTTASKKTADATAFANEKKLASLKAQSSANQLVDTNNGNIASVRMQGAGVIDVKKMLKGNSFVTTKETDDYSTDREQAKAELKNGTDLFVEDGQFKASTDKGDKKYVTFTYKIHNDSSEQRTYKPALSVMIPELRMRITHQDYVTEMEEASTSISEIIGYDKNVAFNKNDVSTYPLGVGQITESVNDDLVKKVDPNNKTPDDSGFENITVNANETVEKTVKVRIDNLQFAKSFNDTVDGKKLTEDFSGTLSDYFDRFYKDAGGNYVEGFLTLEETSTPTDHDKDLSLPYMGFYGDYSKGEAVEPFDFEKEPGKIYNSDLAANYMQNLNAQYQKVGCYLGSTLASRKTKLSSTELANIAAMNANARVDNRSFLSISDGKTNDIYAGGNGGRYLEATFFLNRSVKDATWEILDSEGKSLAKPVSGKIDDMAGAYPGMDGVPMKSFLITSETGYVIHRGQCEIDLDQIKEEGDYKLAFSFTLLSTEANSKVQTRTYNLHVDRTAPKFKGLSYTPKDGGKGQVEVIAEGCNNTISVSGATGAPKQIGTSNDYSVKLTLSKKIVDSDKFFIEMTDFAHNSSTALATPSNIHFVMSSTFYTDNLKYVLTNTSRRGGKYTYTAQIVKGETEQKPAKGSVYTVHIQIKSGLDLEDIEVEVEGEEKERIDAKTKEENWSYDKETGWLSIKMTAQDNGNYDQEFVLNYPMVEDGSTVDPQPDTPDQPEEEEPTVKKKGCSGSIVATSVVGSLLALSVAGLSIAKIATDKKKKEK